MCKNIGSTNVEILVFMQKSLTQTRREQPPSAEGAVFWENILKQRANYTFNDKCHSFVSKYFPRKP